MQRPMSGLWTFISSVFGEKLGDLEEFKIITVRGLGYKAERYV